MSGVIICTFQTKLITYDYITAYKAPKYISKFLNERVNPKKS